jgi:hypothetical protein
MIVWAKANAGQGSLWRSQHELLPVFKLGTAPHVNNVALGNEGWWPPDPAGEFFLGKCGTDPRGLEQGLEVELCLGVDGLWHAPASRQSASQETCSFGLYQNGIMADSRGWRRVGLLGIPRLDIGAQRR